MKLPMFNVSIPFLGITAVELPISLLATDYDNFAMLYSCTPALGLDGYISEMAFVLRRRYNDRSKFLKIREIAWKNGIPYEDFNTIDNSGCYI